MARCCVASVQRTARAAQRRSAPRARRAAGGMAAAPTPEWEALGLAPALVPPPQPSGGAGEDAALPPQAPDELPPPDADEASTEGPWEPERRVVRSSTGPTPFPGIPHLPPHRAPEPGQELLRYDVEQVRSRMRMRMRMGRMGAASPPAKSA